MIFDHITCISHYAVISAGIGTAANWVQSTDLSQLEPGRYEIGNGCYCVIKHGNSKLPENCRLEAHRNFIDIQLIIKGEESMGWMPLEAAIPQDTFHTEKDVGYFAPSQEITFFRVGAGDFAVFFPWDVHCPDVCIGAPAERWKAVIKVPVIE